MILHAKAKAKKTRVIHNILSGSSTNPGIDTIKSLADAYKVVFDESQVLSLNHLKTRHLTFLLTPLNIVIIGSSILTLCVGG